MKTVERFPGVRNFRSFINMFRVGVRPRPQNILVTRLGESRRPSKDHSGCPKRKREARLERLRLPDTKDVVGRRRRGVGTPLRRGS